MTSILNLLRTIFSLSLPLRWNHVKCRMIPFQVAFLSVRVGVKPNPGLCHWHRQFIDIELNCRDRVLGEVRTALLLSRQRGLQWANDLRTVCGNLEGIVGSSQYWSRESVMGSWTFFWWVSGELNGNWHHQPSCPSWCEVSVLLG